MVARLRLVDTHDTGLFEVGVRVDECLVGYAVRGLGARLASCIESHSSPYPTHLCNLVFPWMSLRSMKLG
jgi:hypothetical protein